MNKTTVAVATDAAGSKTAGERIAQRGRFPETSGETSAGRAKNERRVRRGVARELGGENNK